MFSGSALGRVRMSDRLPHAGIVGRRFLVLAHNLERDNLETFIWDMPTGVLRDVWLALSSLQDKSPPGECRLERLLVRWHDNSLESSQSLPNSGPTPIPSMHNPAGSTLTSVGIMIPGGTTAPFQASQG